MESALKQFFIGLLCAISALVMEYIFLILFFPTIDFGSGQNYPVLLFAAVFIEETLKFLAIFKISQNFSPKSKFWGAIYFGIGFSLVEILINIFVVGARAETIPGLAYIALIHLATCSIFGYALSKNAKVGSLIFAWLIALALHLLSNFAILKQSVSYSILDFALSFVIAAILIKSLFFSPKDSSLPNQKL